MYSHRRSPRTKLKMIEIICKRNLIQRVPLIVSLKYRGILQSEKLIPQEIE